MLRSLLAELTAAIILSLIALLLWAAMAFATPAPPTPKGHDFHGTRCQFGDITQKGNRVTIAGPHWSAECTVKGDLLFVEWTQLGNGKVALGLYAIDGETLRGNWGWVGECEWTEADICGTIVGETLWITRP